MIIFIPILLLCQLSLYNALHVQVQPVDSIQSGSISRSKNSEHAAELHAETYDKSDGGVSCCQSLTVSSNGLTADQQWTRLGRYELTGSYAEKAVYTQDNQENFLYYMPDLSLWYIGDKGIGVNRAAILNWGDETCPTDNTDVWEVYAWQNGYDGWIPDPSIKVICE